ncbi:unnamed protein product [Brassica oleracea]
MHEEVKSVALKKTQTRRRKATVHQHPKVGPDADYVRVYVSDKIKAELTRVENKVDSLRQIFIVFQFTISNHISEQNMEILKSINDLINQFISTIRVQIIPTLDNEVATVLPFNIPLIPNNSAEESYIIKSAFHSVSKNLPRLLIVDPILVVLAQFVWKQLVPISEHMDLVPHGGVDDDSLQQNLPSSGVTVNLSVSGNIDYSEKFTKLEVKMKSNFLITVGSSTVSSKELLVIAQRRRPLTA